MDTMEMNEKDNQSPVGNDADADIDAVSIDHIQQDAPPPPQLPPKEDDEVFHSPTLSIHASQQPQPPPPSTISIPITDNDALLRLVQSTTPSQLQSMFIQLNHAYQSVQSQFNDTHTKYQEKLFENTSALKRVETLETELERALKELESLRYDPYATFRVQNNLHHQLSTLRLDKIRLERENALLETQRNEASEQVALLQTDQRVKAGQLTESENERTVLAGLVMELQEKSASSEGELIKLVNANRILEQSLKSYENLDSNDDATTSTESETEAESATTNQCQRCSRVLKNATEQNLLLNDQICNLKTEISRLENSSLFLKQTQLNTAKQLHSERDLLTSTQQKLTSVISQLQKAQLEIANSKKEITSYMSYSESSQRRVLQMMKTMTSQYTRYTEDSKRLEAFLRTQVGEYQSVLKTIWDAIAKVVAECLDLRNIVQLLDDEEKSPFLTAILSQNVSCQTAHFDILSNLRALQSKFESISFGGKTTLPDHQRTQETQTIGAVEEVESNDIAQSSVQLTESFANIFATSSPTSPSSITSPSSDPAAMVSTLLSPTQRSRLSLVEERPREPVSQVMDRLHLDNVNLSRSRQASQQSNSGSTKRAMNWMSVFDLVQGLFNVNNNVNDAIPEGEGEKVDSADREGNIDAPPSEAVTVPISTMNTLLSLKDAEFVKLKQEVESFQAAIPVGESSEKATSTRHVFPSPIVINTDSSNSKIVNSDDASTSASASASASASTARIPGAFPKLRSRFAQPSQPPSSSDTEYFSAPSETSSGRPKTPETGNRDKINALEAEMGSIMLGQFKERLDQCSIELQQSCQRVAELSKAYEEEKIISAELRSRVEEYGKKMGSDDHTELIRNAALREEQLSLEVERLKNIILLTNERNAIESESESESRSEPTTNSLIQDYENQLTALKTERETLQSRLQEAEERFARLQQTQGLDAERIDAFEVAIENRDDDILRLQSEVVELKEQIGNRTTPITVESNTQTSMSIIDVESLQQEVTTLQQALSTKTAREVDLLNSARILTKERDEQEMRVKDLMFDMQGVTDRGSLLERQISELQGRLNDKQAAVRRIETELSQSKSSSGIKDETISDLTQQIQDVKQRLEEEMAISAERVQLLRHQLLEKDMTLKRLQFELDDVKLTTIVSPIQKDASAQVSVLSHSKSVIVQTESTKSVATQHDTPLPSPAVSELAHLVEKENVEHLKTDIQSLQTENDDLRRENQEIGASIVLLQTECDALIKEYRRRESVLRQEIQSLRETIASRPTVHDSTTQTKVTADNSTSSVSNSSSKNSNEELEKKLVKLEELLSLNDKQLQAITIDNAVLIKENDKLGNELDESKALQKRLLDQVDYLERVSQEGQARLLKDGNEMVRLQREQDQYKVTVETEKTKLNEKVSNGEKRISELETELSRAQTDLSREKLKLQELEKNSVPRDDSELLRLQKELDQFKVTLETERGKLNETVLQRETRIAELETERAHSNEKFQELAKKNISLDSQLKKLLNENADLATKLNNAPQQTEGSSTVEFEDEVRELVAELEKELQHALEQRDEKETNLQALKYEYGALQLKYQTIETQHALLRSQERSESDMQIQRLRDTQEEAKEQIFELQKRLILSEKAKEENFSALALHSDKSRQHYMSNLASINSDVQRLSVTYGNIIRDLEEQVSSLNAGLKRALQRAEKAESEVLRLNSDSINTHQSNQSVRSKALVLKSPSSPRSPVAITHDANLDVVLEKLHLRLESEKLALHNLLRILNHPESGNKRLQDMVTRVYSVYSTVTGLVSFIAARSSHPVKPDVLRKSFEGLLSVPMLHDTDTLCHINGTVKMIAPFTSIVFDVATEEHSLRKSLNDLNKSLEREQQKGALSRASSNGSLQNLVTPNESGKVTVMLSSVVSIERTVRDLVHQRNQLLKVVERLSARQAPTAQAQVQVVKTTHQSESTGVDTKELKRLENENVKLIKELGVLENKCNDLETSLQTERTRVKDLEGQMARKVDPPVVAEAPAPENGGSERDKEFVEMDKELRRRRVRMVELERNMFALRQRVKEMEAASHSTASAHSALIEKYETLAKEYRLKDDVIRELQIQIDEAREQETNESPADEVKVEEDKERNEQEREKELEGQNDDVVTSLMAKYGALSKKYSSIVMAMEELVVLMETTVTTHRENGGINVGKLLSVFETESSRYKELLLGSVLNESTELSVSNRQPSVTLNQLITQLDETYQQLRSQLSQRTTSPTSTLLETMLNELFQSQQQVHRLQSTHNNTIRKIMFLMVRYRLLVMNETQFLKELSVIVGRPAMFDNVEHAQEKGQLVSTETAMTPIDDVETSTQTRGQELVQSETQTHSQIQTQAQAQAQAETQTSQDGLEEIDNAYLDNLKGELDRIREMSRESMLKTAETLSSFCSREPLTSPPRSATSASSATTTTTTTTTTTMTATLTLPLPSMDTYETENVDMETIRKLSKESLEKTAQILQSVYMDTAEPSSFRPPPRLNRRIGGLVRSEFSAPPITEDETIEVPPLNIEEIKALTRQSLGQTMDILSRYQ